MIGVVGESLIDVVKGKELVGGCALNVAVAASSLGAPVTFYGKVSSDRYGLMILERLIDNEVLFDPQLCNADEPTLCIRAVPDEEGKASNIFDYKGTAACSITEDELLTAFSNEGNINLVFFGSISLLMEPGCREIVQAIRKIENSPVRFLDPNIRPSLVSDPEAYRKMILELASECELVRVSDGDLNYLYPDIDQAEAERRLLGICRGSLIVTRGAAGYTWYQKSARSFRIDRPCFGAGTAADTIGRGDTFDGAVIAWLDQNGYIRNLAGLEEEAVGRILDYASKAELANADDLE